MHKGIKITTVCAAFGVGLMVTMCTPWAFPHRRVPDSLLSASNPDARYDQPKSNSTIKYHRPMPSVSAEPNKPKSNLTVESDWLRKELTRVTGEQRKTPDEGSEARRWSRTERP